MNTRPTIGILASPGTRDGPSSPLIRFVRDNFVTLSKFKICATGGTARAILATGLYSRKAITELSDGPRGGVVELSALVARGDCKVVVFLADPNDTRSDMSENYALQRVCMECQVRLITTVTGAESWIINEADSYLAETRAAKGSREEKRAKRVFPINWRQGQSNRHESGAPVILAVEEQTVALVAHDKKKMEMSKFVASHSELLSRFDRILATGTTGWLIKALHSEEKDLPGVLRQAKQSLSSERFNKLKQMIVEHPQKLAKVNLVAGRHPSLAKKVMPLPSGPEGGDILIANETLNKRCHWIIFLHDVETAHAHETDIRLLERTCQISGVSASCVSDEKSAGRWADNMAHNGSPSPAHSLRASFGLPDAIVAQPTDDTDSDELGTELASLAAAYLDGWLAKQSREARRLVVKREVRIAVGHGWVIGQIPKQLARLRASRILSKFDHDLLSIQWLPAVGNLTVRPESLQRESEHICHAFKRMYGGRVERFLSAGYFKPPPPPIFPEDARLMKSLKGADLALVSAAPWEPDEIKKNYPDLDTAMLPGVDEAVAIVSLAFLRIDGSVAPTRYRFVGLSADDLNEMVKKRGEVILLCGGESRRLAALAALRANLASVLITTRDTAEWLIEPGQFQVVEPAVADEKPLPIDLSTLESPPDQDQPSAGP